MNDEHKKITIDDYKVQSTKFQVKTCELHMNQSYIMGCKCCRTLFCVDCVSETSSCNNGKLQYALVLAIEVINTDKSLEIAKFLVSKIL